MEAIDDKEQTIMHYAAKLGNIAVKQNFDINCKQYDKKVLKDQGFITIGTNRYGKYMYIAQMHTIDKCI